MPNECSRQMQLHDSLSPEGTLDRPNKPAVKPENNLCPNSTFEHPETKSFKEDNIKRTGELFTVKSVEFISDDKKQNVFGKDTLSPERRLKRSDNRVVNSTDQVR